jgi:autotransporter-associated beta strand protein
MTKNARSLTAALVAAAGLALANSAGAADVTWDNGASNFLWDTTSLNWGGAAWNNAAGNAAIFGGTGVGPMAVPGSITVRSMNFTASGYSLAGPGPLSLTSSGAGTLVAGAVNVDAGLIATINAPITGPVGLQKLGTGALELGGANSITGSITMAGYVTANVQIGSPIGGVGGTLTLLNAGTLPPTTKVGITNGTLDLGSNNVTLAGLTFQNPAANTVVGSGTLRVNGEIHVLGDTSGGNGNTIATNVDLGGGTQMVRVGVNTFFILQNACAFTGTLSNGSLFKSYGLQNTGNQGNTDGIGLYGNNTYTGSTTINGGAVITGTNATTSVTVSGGGIGSGLFLQGANGSLGAAPTIQVVGGALLRLDNNAAIAATAIAPAVAAGQNNNRIRDDAAILLRDASLTLVSLAATPASETFGSLSITGGHNIITLTPTTPASGGTAVLTCAGNLSLGSRATVSVNTPATAPLGGASSQLFINGALPTPDATGLLPRMIGNNTADFLTYSPATGLTPYTGYTINSLATPGVNVALTAATATAGSLAINALKTSGTFTTTITAPDVLTVSSGMVYSTTGTNSFAGGTLNFGATPGVFWGTNTVTNTAALAGSQGLVLGSGTLTLAGNLSALTGMITQNSGTVNLNTNTFTGPIEVRSGQLSLGTSQSGLGTILLGVPEQDDDLFGTVPSLSLSAAGAGATFNANIVVDNGTLSFAGNPLSSGTMAAINPLGNSTGSQTLSGAILLNTPLNLQGGGASGTGATNFTGAISGPSYMNIRNGRVVFGAASTLSNAGGLIIGAGGNTAQVSTLGTASGNGPITMNGGNNTFLAYDGASSIYAGPITIQNSSAAGDAPRVTPLNTSTIANPFNLNGAIVPVVAAGRTGTWSGPISGSGALFKTTVTTVGLTDNTGTLVLSSPSNTYTGAMTVGAGTLVVNGAFPTASAAVNTGAVLTGSGTIGAGVTVNSGGTLAPGSSPGTINTGNLTVSGTLVCDVDLGSPRAADLVAVTGTVTLNATSVLSVNALNAGSPASGTFIIVSNDGTDAVSGTFGSVTGLPTGFAGTVNYAFTGTDSLGRTGDGNDIAIVIEPSCYANCDLSTGSPLLNVNDFICFQSKFAAADPYADCDRSGTLNVNDFICFQSTFAAGCP